MVGILPVSQEAQIEPTPDSCPGSGRIDQGQLCSGVLLGIIKSSLPGALLEKKGGKMAPGIIQFHILRGVLELLRPAVCSSPWVRKLS